MAAILCQSVANLCSNIGTCISYPCRMCGDACGSCCRVTGQMLSSPFSPYLITTLALNVPPAILGLQAILGSLQEGSHRCGGDTWLWVNSLLCVGHVLASFYIVNRIQEETRLGQSHDADAEVGGVVKPTSPSSTNYKAVHDENRNHANMFTMMASYVAAGGKSNPKSSLFGSNDRNFDGQAGSFQRLQQVLCYDLVVAIYILVAIFWLIWQSMGISQAISASYGDGSELCDDVGRWVGVSLSCGFVYCMLVCMTFSCSLLCLRH